MQKEEIEVILEGGCVVGEHHGWEIHDLATFAVRQMTRAFATRMRRYLRYFDKELGLLASFYGDRLDIRPVRIAEDAEKNG